MHDGRSLLVAVATLLSLLFLLACGDADIVIPGTGIPTKVPDTTPTATCVKSGDECTTSGECCSGFCYSPNGIDTQCQ